jgi:hypothetical protein
VFPYLYEGATGEDYQVALSVQQTNCCVTLSKFSTSKNNKNDDTIELVTQEFSVDDDKTYWLTCAFTADDVDDATFQSPSRPTQLFSHETPKIVQTDIK